MFIIIFWSQTFQFTFQTCSQMMTFWRVEMLSELLRCTMSELEGELFVRTKIKLGCPCLNWSHDLVFKETCIFEWKTWQYMRIIHSILGWIIGYQNLRFSNSDQFKISSENFEKLNVIYERPSSLKVGRKVHSRRNWQIVLENFRAYRLT